MFTVPSISKFLITVAERLSSGYMAKQVLQWAPDVNFHWAGAPTGVDLTAEWLR
jgi:hypothetical protein